MKTCDELVPWQEMMSRVASQTLWTSGFLSCIKSVKYATTSEPKKYNLLHFVAFFQVASLLSLGVDNRKVGADNRKVGADNRKRGDRQQKSSRAGQFNNLASFQYWEISRTSGLSPTSALGPLPVSGHLKRSSCIFKTVFQLTQFGGNFKKLLKLSSGLGLLKSNRL